MSNLIEHTMRWENAQLEAIFNEDLRCEGAWHPLGKGGHDDGPAAFVVVSLCCGRRRLFCAARVAAIRADPYSADCSKCDAHPAPVRFIEL